MSSPGDAILTITGTELKQNTLNEVAAEEDIAVSGPGLYITSKTWTGETSIVSDGSCTADILYYSGFSLDKTAKLNKIIIKGKCSELVNQLDIKAKVFAIDYQTLSVSENSALSIDKTFTAPVGEYYWHKEFSVGTELIKGVTELVLEIGSPSPVSWNSTAT